MLCGIPFALLKFWEVLNNSLHVFNCVELGLTFLGLKELLDHVVDCVGNITEVRVHDLFEESVFVTGECHFLHLIS